MDKRRWKRLARLEELPEGVPLAKKIGSKEFLIVRRGKRVFACANRCPHQGANLNEGLLLDRLITCPWHQARFDLQNGAVLAPPALDGIPTYRVEVEEGEVFIGPVDHSPELPRVAEPAGEDLLPSRAVGAEPAGKGAPIPRFRGAGRKGREKETFVIVGGGAAGSAAAETLRKEGFGGRIILVTAEGELPYDRTALSKGFLTGEIPPDSLPLRDETFYQALEIELLRDHRVSVLDPAGKSMVFAGGGKLGYDKLLLATGGRPRKLRIPKGNLVGCYLLRNKAEAELLLAALGEAEQVLISGAGFIGLEVASSIRSRGLEVAVVAPEDLPLRPLLGPEVAEWIRDLHQDHGVRFYLGRTIREIRGRRRLEEVVLSDGTRLAAQVLVIGIGIDPQVDYLAGTSLLQEGAVPVNPRLETEAPDLLAAGDMAAVPHSGSGRRLRVEHWVNAQAQGQHAARVMLGSREPYCWQPFFWTDQYRRTLSCVGLPGDFDQLVIRGSLEANDFLVGYYRKGSLRAAAAVGRERELALLGEVLSRGQPLSPEQLRDGKSERLSAF